MKSIMQVWKCYKESKRIKIVVAYVETSFDDKTIRRFRDQVAGLRYATSVIKQHDWRCAITQYKGIGGQTHIYQCPVCCFTQLVTFESPEIAKDTLSLESKDMGLWETCRVRNAIDGVNHTINKMTADFLSCGKELI